MLGINIYIAFFIAIITAVIIYFRHRFTYWSRRGISGPKFVEWKGFFTKHHDWTVEQIKKYGRVYGAYDFSGRSLIVNEPDFIRDIMVKDFHIFPNRKNINLGSAKTKLSVFFLPGNEDWKRIRSIVSPTFTSGKLRQMMSSISDISDKFVVNLDKIAEKGEVVDIRHYVGAFAMDVISACAYGINTDSIKDPNHPIVVNVKKILNVDVNISLFLSVFAAPIARFLKLEPFDINATNYFDALTNKIIEERKKINETQENKRKKTDFLQLMIDTERSDKDLDIDPTSDDESFKVEETVNNLTNGNQSQKVNKTLSSDEMTAQGILFFIAGYDTTSAAISHAIYYLSQYKECQQKLYEELQTITDFSYETLNKLKYLNAVIKETLRLAPSLTRIQRECVADYKLGNTGITIPAGTSIEILPYALHRDPEFFPEPEVFKPERFLDDSKYHPYAYIPFGGGPRLCLGMRFALNEMRMCVSKLVNKFEFSLAPDFKIDYFDGNILITPKKLMVYLKQRN